MGHFLANVRYCEVPMTVLLPADAGVVRPLVPPQRGQQGRAPGCPGRAVAGGQLGLAVAGGQLGLAVAGVQEPEQHPVPHRVSVEGCVTVSPVLVAGWRPHRDRVQL